MYAHHFIKELDDRNQLLLNFTQNIDGLELLAGLSEDKLIQAHGHMRTAHCIDCQKECSFEETTKARTYVYTVLVLRFIRWCDRFSI